ncbi:hypothetical protein MDAP_001564 [Mitosporidium daphniae]
MRRLIRNYSGTNGDFWKALKIAIEPKVQCKPHDLRELKVVPEYFTSYIPKVVADKHLKIEKEEAKLHARQEEERRSQRVSPIPPQERPNLHAHGQASDIVENIPVRSTKISDAINQMFYRFLSSSDSLQGDECLNDVQITAISLDAKLQSCKMNIHIDAEGEQKSQLLSILLRNERSSERSHR